MNGLPNPSSQIYVQYSQVFVQISPPKQFYIRCKPGLLNATFGTTVSTIFPPPPISFLATTTKFTRHKIQV